MDRTLAQAKRTLRCSIPVRVRRPMVVEMSYPVDRLVGILHDRYDLLFYTSFPVTPF